MRTGLKGEKNPMWRNARIHAKCEFCGKEFSYYKGSSSGKYCSHSCSHLSPEFREKQASAKRGLIRSEASKKKQSLATMGVKKSDGHRASLTRANRKRFEGHIHKTKESIRERMSDLGRLWTKNVLERDGKRCQNCQESKGKMIAHHIISFSVFYKEYRMGLISRNELHDITNGVTWCEKCHDKYHGKYGKTCAYTRLIRVLQKLHKQLNLTEPFSVFYERQTNLIIEKIKSKLEHEN